MIFVCYLLGFTAFVTMGTLYKWRKETDPDDAVSTSIAIVGLSLIWPITTILITVLSCVEIKKASKP